MGFLTMNFSRGSWMFQWLSSKNNIYIKTSCYIQGRAKYFQVNSSTHIWPPSCPRQLLSAAETSLVLSVNKYFECLPRARHCSRFWRVSGEQNWQGPCPGGAYSLGSFIHTNPGAQRETVQTKSVLSLRGDFLANYQEKWQFWGT